MDSTPLSKRSAFIDGVKLSEEDAESYRNKEEYIVNDSKKFELYQDFISNQKQEFKAIMYYFNDMLTSLKKQGKISNFVEFRARIKATKSALKNDGEKALDDVFAMEFLGATEKEVDFMLAEVTKKAMITRRKNHNKPNGYKAKHRVFALYQETIEDIMDKFGDKLNLNENNFPMFECQFKTIAVAIEAYTGTAKHINYKNIDPKDIQKKFDNDGFALGYDIPQMWASKDGKMEKLSSDETLKKLYPFLDITKKIER